MLHCQTLKAAGRTLVAALALVMLTAPTASAYGVLVHGALPRYTFPATANDETLPAVTRADLTNLRRRFYRTAATLPDETLRRRFLSRYPAAGAFDAAAFKHLLGLNPERRVWGIDEGPATPGTRLQAVSTGAVKPDTDRRNQDRLLRGPDGRLQRLPDGSPIPVDPMILAMGLATGTSSQAHAHYGLVDLAKSDSPAVLQQEPRRFAMPADIQTFAAPMAQTYTDLAVMAAVWGMPTLAATHEGAFQHHAADVANQIHTVQVGLYDFFFDAKLQAIKETVLSGWGLLGPVPTFRDIGIRILANHHFLSEEYFVKRLTETLDGKPHRQVQAALAALRQGDPALGHRLEVARRHQEAWAQAMVSVLIDTSSREGADLYAATRGFAAPRLSRAGEAFHPERDDPDAFVRSADDADAAAALGRYYELYRRAFGRVGEIFRAWRRAFADEVARPGADEAAVARLVARQLDYLEGMEQRRARWLAEKDAARPQVRSKKR